MTQRRALLLQGDAGVRALLRRQLILQDFRPTYAADGNAAWTHLKARVFDLIVLGSVPSGMDLTTLCRAIRRPGPNQRSAIIVVSALREEAERVLALTSGADYYVTIPFSVLEFQARISALMRRSHLRHALGTRRVRDAIDLTLDQGRRTAKANKTPLSLTRREFDLLHSLVASPGVVFTRQDLVARLGLRSAVSSQCDQSHGESPARKTQARGPVLAHHSNRVWRRLHIPALTHVAEL
jgi:two-component system alkaline phosphatase synthesis response regulator PhoP